jgi:uncharacterized RDD family membrane protein YckC
MKIKSKKAVAFFIDLVGSYLIFGYIIGLIDSGATANSISYNGWYDVIAIVLVYLYFFTFDRYLGGTLGKRIFRVKPIE